MNLLKKIEFKRPKYMIPALIYFPLLFTGYFVIDTFNTEKAEVQDPNMETTDYINPNLPQAKVKDDLEGKYESMLKSYGKISDLSAIGNIERDGSDDMKEEYQSQYTDKDIAAMDSIAMEQARTQARLQEMQEQLRQSAERGRAMTDGMTDLQTTEDERLKASLKREQELEAELARLRSQGEAAITGSTVQASHAGKTASISENAVTAPSADDEVQQVVKRIMQPSDYFHTIAENEPQTSLIKAIIDEDIKAVDGSRVRLRLLDDVQVGEVTMRKGSYIYATMSGFGSQRVKGNVTTVLIDDEIIKVSLSMYDTDGLEGLYVPESSFRETAKDVASGALSGNMNFNQGTGTGSLSQWGMQAVQNAYSRTTNAISKSIKKNSAKLKYGTFVYLVNGRD